MVVYLDNLKINTLSLSMLGKGSEGICYKYNDVVLKIHYSSNSTFLNEETALKLMKIKTNRINVPISLVYDSKNKYIGYTKKYVDEKNNVRDITNQKLIEELKLIKEDVKSLSSNGILLTDCNNLYNIIYDGNINYIDPGSFTLVNYNPLYKNYDIINQSIYDLLFDTIFFDKGELKKIVNSYNLSFYKRIFLKKIISEIVYTDFKNNSINYIDYLINNLKGTNNLNEYRIYLLKNVRENGSTNEFINSNINKIKKLVI